MKSTEILKPQSKTLKNKNIKRNHICGCLCARFILKNRRNKDHQEPTATHNSEREIVESDSKNDKQFSKIILNTKKTTNKGRIIRIPKNGCDSLLLKTIFTKLSKTGGIAKHNAEITRAVNLTLEAKNDLHEGKQWNGPIEVTNHLKLKLYKTGLVLHYKK